MQYNSNPCDLLMWSSDSPKFILKTAKNRCDPGLKSLVCGFKVTCITLDGHSVNRKFFKLIANGSTELVQHKCKNPLSFNEREIYLFSDPPHLIKTARNCLASQIRNMQVCAVMIDLSKINYFLIITV